ncbi:hypothetical protein QA641_02920 [Bradyrhizobium sp. CB1650]|uniref:hypothetical protein n=1 Tax=Bradyrhizobium sp. CB1650 TaxID=3039153 RepID=UPI00243550B4|nr:hypothetical protein [Bradyrhizobium sp. CB1650]WGD52914.1 hypothetical protein QA641_02920 [Bradyrhizobium sp. CB1650]
MMSKERIIRINDQVSRWSRVPFGRIVTILERIAIVFRPQGNYRHMKLALFLSLVPTSAVNAEAAADLMKSWGLLGKWGTECHKMAWGENASQPEVTFAIEPDGKLIYENSGQIGDVISASSNADGSITVKLQFFKPSNDSRTIVVERIGQGIRTILNRNDRNEYSIRNGVFVTTGKQAPSLYKCS